VTPVRHLCWILLALALGLPGPAVAIDVAPRAPSWDVLVSGLTYARIVVNDPTLGLKVRVHALRFRPDRFELRAADKRATRRKLSSARQFARTTGALAAFNGGYFDPAFRPLGLIVSQGKEWSPLRKVDHGIFYVAGGKAGVVHRMDWSSPADLEFAIECGPRLLVNGEPTRTKPGFARRTALGVNAAGEIVAVVTEGALTMEGLVEVLRKPEADGGLGLREALNLDGGSSTMLYLNVPDHRAEVDSGALVPVGVVVLAR